MDDAGYCCRTHEFLFVSLQTKGAGFNMSNLHRIRWIDAQIRAGRYPNARIIAEQFEISPRQAARDIEYLRYSMGAPLEYNAAKNGYDYSDGAFTLPAYFVTHEEKQALSYLAHQYRSVGTDQAAQLSSLFARLTGDAEEEVFAQEPPTATLLRTLPLPPTEQFIEEILRTAISERHKVVMAYVKVTGEKSEREFAPYKIFATRNIRYIVGYCDLRNELRVFRISRIERIRVLEESFTPVTMYNPDDYQDDHPLRFIQPYTAEVLLESPPDAPLRFGGEPLGDMRYKFFFRSSNDFLNYMVGTVGRFSILNPRWLKEKLRLRLKNLLSMNEAN